MSYVKKYDVGQIKVDLPYANYIHELPLLSIGDVKHNINLSLVFNYNRHKEESENGSNPFFIAPGYKLNLQKRLTSDEQGDPAKIQEANGEFIDLNKIYPHTFTFNDESQRILRSTEQHTLVPVPGGNVEYGPVPYDHNVEHPDFSRERYNEAGRITVVYDKYNNAVLSYEYNGYGQLISIVCGGTKTIYFEYESDRLESITYENCEIVFNYNDAMLQSIEHYSGDVYEFSLSGMEYTVQSKENATTVVYSKELRLSDDNKIIQVSDKIGDNTVNTVSYRYPYDLFCEMWPYSYVDTIDNNGVETRMQFVDGKATCSYEIKNGQVLFGGEHYQSKVLSNVTLYKAARAYDNFEATGVQTRNDGNSMNRANNLPVWKREITDELQKKGYYTLSGWIKYDGEDGPVNHCVNIESSNSFSQDYGIGTIHSNQWKYFSIMFYTDSNFIDVDCKEDNNILSRDLRLTFQGTANSMSEYVLFNGNNTIPFKNIKFYYTNAWGETVELSNVMLSDVLRYKLRKKKYGLYNEYYSENCTNILYDATNLRINHNDSYIGIGDLDLGVRVYSDGKELLTRFNIDEDDQSSNIVKIHTVNGTEVGREILNSKFDVIESISNGISTVYTRNLQGLLIGESVSGLYKRNISYDSNCVSVDDVDPDTNDILSTTQYHIDSIWGGVTKVEVLDSDGTVQSVIEDTYDGDMSTFCSRIFENSSRENTVGYSNGRVNSIGNGGVEFEFGYAEKGELASISKNNESIEVHTFTLDEDTKITTVQSYYPAQSGALNTITKTFDKYGRLTAINGQLENVFDFYPSYVPTNNCPMQAPNSCAVLEKINDLKTGNVYEYSYNDKNQISQKQTKNSSGTVISTETFGYDDSNRLTSDNCTYDTSSSKSVGSAIGYESSSDNRIKSYGYSLNGTVKANTSNDFDAYKRLSKKTYTVGGKAFSKEITYNKTKLERVEDKCGNTTLADTSYEYDCLGRIKAINDTEYKYDEYGQLMEEKTLDKTIKYTYNGIGNIKSVNYYSGNSSTPYKTETYGYSGDRLTSYNGEAITHNANGCPTTYNGYAITWQNGKLTRFRMGMKLTGMHDYTYSYNGLGQRIKRSYKYTAGSLVGGSNDVYWGMLTSSDRTMSYDYSGRLISESIEKTYYGENGSRHEDVVYLYDENSVIGMVYTNSDGTNTYYFQRNLLGDIIGIYDTNGNKVGGYKYDAWGNYELSGDTTNYDATYANPFRYRGYYYDDDMKIYYLNARYYSPKWRRFISPDETDYIDPETPNGLNLYCYCGNDPVNFVDPSGHSWESFWNGVEDWFEQHWIELAVGAGFIVGGAALAFFTAGMGTAGLLAAGSALSASTKAVCISMAVNSSIGAIAGGINGGWNGALQGFGDGLANGFMWGGIFAGSAQTLGYASKALASRNVDFANSFNWLFGNRNSYSTTLLRVNKSGKQLFRVDADINHLWHLHFGNTSAAMRIHRTGIVLTSYLGLINLLNLSN